MLYRRLAAPSVPLHGVLNPFNKGRVPRVATSASVVLDSIGHLRWCEQGDGRPSYRRLQRLGLFTSSWRCSRPQAPSYIRKTRIKIGYRLGDFGGDFGVGTQNRDASSVAQVSPWFRPGFAQVSI